MNKNDSRPTTRPEGSIVRYIGVDIGSWTVADALHNYSDLYSQVQLTGPVTAGAGQNPTPGSPPPDLRNYSQENRHWYQQLVSSKTDTVTTAATVTVQDPTLKVALPLFSITHGSGLSLGNTWATNFTASNYASPLFRLGPNTAVTISIDASVSSDVKSQGAASALSALTQAVRIAAPTSTLLTPLSKTDVANTATAIDSTISSLASRAISEEVVQGRLFSTWFKDARVDLTGCAPSVRLDDQSTASAGCSGTRDMDGVLNTQVGQWSIRFACPRPSAFDVRDICGAIGGVGPDDKGTIDMSDKAKRTTVQKAIADSVSDNSVLSFNLSSQVSVQTYFLSQNWYSDFIAANAPGATAKGVDATTLSSQYTSFCAAALGGMEAGGLNQLDAALVLRAAIHQLPKLTVLKANFAGAPGADCRNLLGDIGVTIN